MDSAQLTNDDLGSPELSPWVESCLICRLRDAVDRAVTASWLMALHGDRSHHGDALGVACCPLHAWRLYELLSGSDDRAQDASSANDGGTPQGTRSRHARIARILEHVLEAFAADLAAAQRQYELSGRRLRIVGLRRSRPPGLLWQRPTCPLCRHAAGEKGRETGILERFAHLYEASQPVARQAISRWLCPRDRRLGYPLVRHDEAFLLPVRAHGAGVLPVWSVAPAPGAEDRSFVARLLASGDIPDAGCPACWVRCQHERTLMAELSTALAAPHTARSEVNRSPPTNQDGGSLSASALDDLCPRHTALVRATLPTTTMPVQTDTARDTRDGDTTNLLAVPAQWPYGVLRAIAREDGCPACMAIRGWDLARLEGLRRAAGGALLYDELTHRLRQALTRRQQGFCLPHWRQATATAELDVTLTLLDFQTRSIGALRASITDHEQRLRTISLSRGDELDGDAGSGPEVCACAALAHTLAGYPA